MIAQTMHAPGSVVLPDPNFDAMTPDQVAAWADAEALAMVREMGYSGLAAERLLLRGWPLEAVDWRLDTYPAPTAVRRRALELARQLVTGGPNAPSGLGLAGRTGRGKTGLACSIGAALDAAGRDVRFVRWGTVVGEAFATIGQRGRSVEGVTAPLAEADVLILDDLGDEGAGAAPDFTRRVLREILWPRYERKATTVFTTNLREPEMVAQFVEAAASRLFGMVQWLVLDGPDERRQAVDGRAA